MSRPEAKEVVGLESPLEIRIPQLSEELVTAQSIHWSPTQGILSSPTPTTGLLGLPHIPSPLGQAESLIRPLTSIGQWPPPQQNPQQDLSITPPVGQGRRPEKSSPLSDRRLNTERPPVQALPQRPIPEGQTTSREPFTPLPIQRQENTTATISTHRPPQLRGRYQRGSGIRGRYQRGPGRGTRGRDSTRGRVVSVPQGLRRPFRGRASYRGHIGNTRVNLNPLTNNLLFPQLREEDKLLQQYIPEVLGYEDFNTCNLTPERKACLIEEATATVELIKRQLDWLGGIPLEQVEKTLTNKQWAEFKTAQDFLIRGTDYYLPRYIERENIREILLWQVACRNQLKIAQHLYHTNKVAFEIPITENTTAVTG